MFKAWFPTTRAVELNGERIMNEVSMEARMRATAHAPHPAFNKTSQGSSECERRWRQSEGDHGKMTSPLQTDKHARALRPAASDMPVNE